MIDFLDAEHPRYSDRKGLWERYWDLYVGGEQLRRNASRHLIKRQKEPTDVYGERLSRVFYENYLGSCIDWYAAALFRTRPTLQCRTSTSSTAGFYKDFVSNCDCRNTGLFELLRQTFLETLVFGESYLRIDFPEARAEASSRAEEDSTGASRAYVAPCSPLELINWSQDSTGEFEWAVLRSTREFQPSPGESRVIRETRWTRFDRENYEVYVQCDEPSDRKEARMVARGRHGFANLRRVPLMKMSVSEGLWLANKAGLLAKEHLNKSNALSWALHMGLFAMPVVYSERDWQQMVGEAYYIQLGPDDRFGWTEPEGKVFQIAAENLDRLKDEIYRVCYLMTQAGGREARHLSQSGESKRRDFAVTHEVLRSYGTMLRDFVSKLIRTVAEARKDEVEIEISGLDQFEHTDLRDEIQTAHDLKKLGLNSPRLTKEMRKRIALKYLETSSQATKDAVLDEIECCETGGRADG